jgi:hypothetical protein
MRRRFCAWILAAGLIGILGQACRHGGAPRFNEEALFYGAVLIPADGNELPVNRPALEKALAGAAWPNDDWSQAGQAARSLLTSPGLKIQLGSSEDFPIPEVQYLTAFGYGMSQEEMLRCAAAQKAYQLILNLPPRDVARQYPAFQALLLAAAQATKGFIYDVNAKTAFTPGEFGGCLFNPLAPDLSRHVLVQRYPYQPGRYRVATLGMATFGCPDLEIRDFPAKDAMLLDRLTGVAAARLVAIRLAAGGTPAFPAVLELDPAAIKGGAAPATAAPEKIRVGLVAGELLEGDPQDNIVRLAPPEGFSGGLAEWVSDLSDKVFGYQIKVDYMSAGGIPPDKIQKARAGLPEVRRRFLAAGTSGEEYYIKFAYTIEGSGVEYLWMRVGAWDDSGISGTLVTEPFMAKRLAAGKPLRITESQAVDWLIRSGGGKVEGRLTE